MGKTFLSCFINWSSRKMPTKAMVLCEPGHCCPFQFFPRHPYSCNSGSEVAAGPIISRCGGRLPSGFPASDASLAFLRAERRGGRKDGSSEICEVAREAPGTCEEAPRRSSGDNGRWRLAGLYFVHMIHFTRIQATPEWRISTSFHLIERRDSKQTNRRTG